MKCKVDVWGEDSFGTRMIVVLDTAMIISTSSHLAVPPNTSTCIKVKLSSYHIKGTVHVLDKFNVYLI